MNLTLLPVRKERVEHLRYAILAVLQVLDVALTGFILASWTERAEANPITAFIFNGLGLRVGLLVVLAFKLAAVYIFWSSQTKTKLANTIYSLVLFNNLLFLILWLLQG